MKHSNKKQKKRKHLSTLTSRFLLFILAIVFSLNSVEQTVCVANIDNGNTEICLGTGIIKTFSNAIASGGTIDWISSGDGTFNDPTLPNPTYTAGPNDIANGYVFIYLDVYKDDPVNPGSALPVAILYLSSMNASATPATQSVCSGAAITPIVLSGSLSTITYNWSRNNTTSLPGIAATGSGTIKGAFANIASAPATVTFTVTPTASSCTGTPFTATVVVNPKPTAVATPSSQTICSGATITPVTLSSAMSGTTFNWTRNNTGSVTGMAASGSGNITGTLINTTTSPVTVTFTITPTGNGCTGTAITITIVVNPSQNIVATPSSQTICSGATIVPITFSGGPYNWTRNNTGSVTGIATSGSGNISGALTNATSAPATVTFTTWTAGCPGVAAVTVNPIPNAIAAPSSQTICSDLMITPIILSGNITGTTYNWSRDNPALVTGIGASGSGDISCSLSNSGTAPVVMTFVITPTANGCTGSATSSMITVTPHPTSLISGNQAICAGQQLSNINIALTGTAPWNFTYTNGTTPVTVTGNTANPYSFAAPALPATYTVTSLNDASCTALAANITGSATLSQTNYTITASAEANGSIGPNGSTSVNCGNSQTFSITPNSCYQIADVLVDGVSKGAVSTYAFTNVTSTHILSATFSQISYTINANAGANGSITPNGATPVNCGSSQVYTITPNAGYNIQNVLVDGAPQGAISTYTFSNVTAPHTISATFASSAPGTFTITTNAGANGTITPGGAVSVNSGASQTFSIAANSCYQITDVSVDGISQGAVSTYTFSNVTAAHTISATFAQISYTINANAGANGSITPNGATPVNCGSSQVYTITPNAGYNIQNVLVDGAPQGAISTYTFSNVTAPHTISATFASSAPGTFTFTTNAGANGTITPGGAVSVNSGASQTFSIAANSCYQITDVSVDGISQGAVSTYTFSNVTAAHTISATFSQISYGINASTGANGSITLNGTTSVNCGGSQSYAITPNAGYNIQNVLVDGAPQGAISTYTFSNVTAPHTISATFASSAPGTFTITTNAGANGTITPGGAVSVNSGASQTFSIAANSCYQITDVSVDGISQGAVSTYTFSNVTAAHTISATFSQISYGINASTGANGSITPNGTTPVSCGASQTFSIAANSCYQIADVLVDGVSQGPISTYTFTNVTATHSISTSFLQISYLITASAGSNGTITSPGSTSVNCGSSQTYNIAANTGFSVQTVLIDGVSAGNVNAVTFSNVTAPHTLSVTFIAVSGCAAPMLSASIANVLCRNGSTGAINVTTSGGTAPFTYAWTGPNNFTAAIKDITALAAGNYRITVTAAGGCTAIGNYFVGQPSGTLGTTAASWNPILCNGGATNVVINAVGGTLPYTGTGTIPNQLAGVHTYTITDANGCTTATTVNIIQPTANTANSAAGAVQCGTGTAILTVTATGGTGTKQYSLNGGAYQSGNTFTVTPAGSPYIITVKDANQCTVQSNSVTVIQPTSSAVPVQPASITGPTYGLCGGGTFSYSVGSVTDATGYTWAPAAGWAINSGQGTNQIQVSVPSNFTGPTSIGVAAVNSCGTGAQYRVSVFGILYYPGSSISGPSTVVRNQANVQYSLPSTPGTTFTWLVPSGASITSGQGTNSITVNFGTSSGNLSVDVQNACGTAPRSTKIVTVAASRPAALTDQILAADRTDFSVYPNPAENNATLEFGSLKAGSKFEVMISNTIGKTLLFKSGITVAGKNILHFDLNKFTNGMYLVRLITEEGIQIQKLYKR